MIRGYASAHGRTNTCSRDTDLIAFGRMRDDRRLFRIIPRLAVRRVLLGRKGWGRPFLIERSRAAQGRKRLRHDNGRQRHREYCAQQEVGDRSTMIRSLYAFNAHCAFLEVGLKRDRIGGVERHLVDELALIKPRNEYDTARHAVASARFKAGADEATPRLDLHFVAAPQVERWRHRRDA